MVARALEWMTVAVHYAAMAYIVGGGFLAWRWRWARWPHLVMIGWAVLSLLWSGAVCPLTWLEDLLRHIQGEGDLQGGFVDTYLTGVIYPADAEHTALAVSTAIVLVSWVGAFLKWRVAGRSASSSDVEIG